MPISKMQSESVDLADSFAFTGTVTGAGTIKHMQFATISGDTGADSSKELHLQP